MEIRIADKHSRIQFVSVEDAWLIDRGLNIGNVWPAE